MRLSILTLSLPSRIEKFLRRIVAHLNGQIGDQDVELLCFLDNQRISVGEKWNTLIRASTGRYITVIGDDDLPSDDYVESLLRAVDEADGVDCIVFDSEFYRDGKLLATCHWGLEYEYRDEWEGGEIWRYPGELMAIRRDIRLKHPYPDVFRGSDWRQARDMRPDLTTQHRIVGSDGNAKVLYKMYNRSGNDEHIRAEQLRRAEKKAKRRQARLEQA